MATSVLENILANIKTTLEGVTTGNGYDFTIQSVQRFQVGGPALVSLPAAIIGSIDQDKLVETTRTMEWQAGVRIDLYISHDVEADPRSTDEILTEARANLYKALMADRTRGGHAVDATVEKMLDFNLVLEDGNDTGVLVMLNVRFRHAQGDPSQAV